MDTVFPAGPDTPGTDAPAYHRGRPDFPEEAAAWLAGKESKKVLELGAGTGKLTQPLYRLGHRVTASDTSTIMLDELSEHLPTVVTWPFAAEDIPASPLSYDIVVSAESFHYFDAEKALAQVARVLRPEGRLALAWSFPDVSIPWVKKVGRIIGNQRTPDSQTACLEALKASPLFGTVAASSFSFWQSYNEESLVDLARSHFAPSSLPVPEQERRFEELRELYRSYGRGRDGLKMPLTCYCFGADVRREALAPPPELPAPTEPPKPYKPDGAEPARNGAPAGSPEAASADRGKHAAVPAAPPSDDDAGSLLIDFR